ncbi:hypothetical protein AD929_03600 [Gluconobacter potus]|uniref:Uncharacterized protein n=1 Tax=Gluconobacter potus TaxID=2724927 RepID=A0A149QXZ7_9PROT|nr:hypothetical protein AD929_03600 [Gluconobacter potus]
MNTLFMFFCRHEVIKHDVAGSPPIADTPHHKVSNRPGMTGRDKSVAQKADILRPGLLRAVHQTMPTEQVIGVEHDALPARGLGTAFRALTGHEYRLVIRRKAAVKERVDGVPVSCRLLIMDVEGAITAEIPGEAGFRHEYNRFHSLFSMGP